MPSQTCNPCAKDFLSPICPEHTTVGSLKCVWDGNPYTNIAVSRGSRDFPNWIGLRFLARHLVTFDFPNATMYLKQTRSGPLVEQGKTGAAAKTTEPAAAPPPPRRCPGADWKHCGTRRPNRARAGQWRGVATIGVMGWASA